MNRSYYSAPVTHFCAASPDSVLGKIASQNPFSLTIEQKVAWQAQIEILQNHLDPISHRNGHVFFEFSIPRMGKRVDVVLTLDGLVFAIEFKVGMKEYSKYAIDQAVDYCLDLKNFHEGSHNKLIVPVLVATAAPSRTNDFEMADDRVSRPLLTNDRNLISEIDRFLKSYAGEPFNGENWAQAPYRPTPTIVEAAKALYKGHKVEEISRSDAGAENLTKTAAEIDRVIQHSKATGQKSICFITGVPGSGKTLAGLNIANQRHNIDEGEHAVFLSGNGPLVRVLREALARDQVLQQKEQGELIKKADALSKTSVFIQNIHHFRDTYLEDQSPPIERVAVFDEAQRAWTRDEASSFMKRKKGIQDFSMSEPEFLIEVMDRHEGYVVIVCLIGGGQEINRGEAGLPEWFSALSRRFGDWHVYVSDRLTEQEYTQGQDLKAKICPEELHLSSALHLAMSVRSFRAEAVSDFVKHVLDGESQIARETLNGLADSYPIYLTRDLDQAKAWLKHQSRGTERTGIVASSGALRLKPEGVNIKAKADPVNWFLNPTDDVRSSNYLEDVATEFDVQGLELDWTCVAWDINFYRDRGNWVHRKFSGTKWVQEGREDGRKYLKNAYRVLLTRARQGMVIYVPQGQDDDPTRPPELYDSIADYLGDCGIKHLPR